MGFKELFDTRKNLIENSLNEFVPQKNNPQGIIYEAMRYSLLGGGKRIRGVLALSGASLAGENADRVLPVACGMEMIHAYSLIHDDLPAMDNDDFRRGKPSCHKKFDEATAILAGDALLNGAFELMLKTDVKPEILKEVLKTVSTSSGTEGMIGGQVVDMGEKVESYEDLTYLHAHKTGALILASLLAGYIAGGGNNSQITGILKEYAEKLGLAFQVIDDILDVSGDEKLLGKPIGSDAKNSKKTFITFMGYDGAKEFAEKLSREAAEIVKPLGEEGEFLAWFALYLTERKF